MRTKFLFLSIFLFLSTLLQAQKPATIDPYRSNQFGIETPLCFGTTRLSTGITTNTRQAVYISPGGGSSIGLRYGTMVSKKVQFSLGVAYQWSPMTPAVSNASGGFRRFNLNPQLRYFLYTHRERGRFYVGAGVMVAAGVKMHIDASAISGGAKNNFIYNAAPGFCAEVGYEKFFSRLVSLDIGLRYRYHSFSLKSVTSNGHNVPLDQLPPGFDYIRKVDGSGVDITVALRFNF